MKRSDQVYFLYNNSNVWRFLRARYGFVIDNSDDARDAIISICGVDTRFDFDKRPDDAAKWDRFVEKFREWEESLRDG